MSRLDRDDIKRFLNYGDQTKIAKNSGVSIETVRNVLDGKRNDYHNVIREAELVAAINIWKTKYCKTISLL